MKKDIKITTKQARQLANLFNIDLRKINIKEWKYALDVELEHGTRFKRANVTNDDLIMTAKIALAHLLEFPDYYKRLKKMEHEAEKYWEKKNIKSIFKSKKK